MTIQKHKIVLNDLQHRVTLSAYSLANLSLGAMVFHSSVSCDVDLHIISHPVGSTSESIAKTVLSENPNICGFSVNALTETTLIDAIRLIKLEQPDIIIVVGGSSLVYTQIPLRIGEAEADLFIVGEGERIFFDIVIAYCNNCLKEIIEAKRIIPGVFPKCQMGIKLSHSPILDLASIPSPYALINGLSFYSYICNNMNHIYWETSRGCVFKCGYCSYPHRRPIFRTIPICRLQDEIKYFNRYDIKSIFVTDPILGGPKQNTKNVLRLISKIESKPRVSVLLRPEYLDSEMAELLYNANVKWIDLGLQTVNPKLSWIRNNDLDMIMGKFQTLRDANIDFNVDLIVGLPDDSPESMLESLRFVIEEICPATLKVFPLRVYAGTPLHDLVVRKGSRWLKYDKDTRLILETDSCNREDLKKIMRLSNIIVSMYRYFAENNWFENEATYRSFCFFKKLYKTLLPFEFADPDVWHITNCPQNAYDPNICKRVWISYSAFLG